MASQKTTTKLYIPHPDVPGCSIAGILEQAVLGVVGAPETASRNLALILHGAMGHRDYLFQKGLAQRLPMDSFRFDFRSNNETPGPWNLANFTDDIADIQAVVDYLAAAPFNYVVTLIAGHSRGGIVGFKWVCVSPQGRQVKNFINLSSRYRMEKIYDRLSIYQSSFDKYGYYDWKVVVARKEVVGRLTRSDVDKFATWDTSFVETQLPAHIDVLTIHGLQDEIVPTYDAVLYARALSNRTPGSHTLHLMEGANHNFVGYNNQVITTILDWLELRDKRQVKAGLWQPAGSKL